MSRPRYDWWQYVKSMIRKYPAIKDAEVGGVLLREKEAVRAAVESTGRMRNGRDRLAVIDMVFWRQTFTLTGAAMQVPCHYDTAQGYHADFIREVARNFRCDGLLEK